MYVPRPNQMDPDQARVWVRDVGAGELITVGEDGFPLATRLPLLWDGEVVRMHMAAANPQWRSIPPDAPALIVVTGPEGYISPNYYATKREHGRVVPTWNYVAVQLRGRVTVRRDDAWLEHQIAELTDHFERTQEHPWAVADAPGEFIEQQRRAIVGLEFAVEEVTGKAKLSQNRSEADVAGVIEGLGTDPGRGGRLAAAMRA